MSVQNDPITPEQIAEHGLSKDEYKLILEILDRPPTPVELGIFSVMWSEHCSYKSSKHWLSKLPTEAPWVICGPGENAGIVDVGGNMAAVFKAESHNHPSFIEPYQGAATGVGGILRDIFTMGARPVAILNALRFGSPDHPKTRHLVDGVVAGIGGYGNCIGVPTVGGETTFHAAYNGNNLVNAMCVGLAEKDRIFYAAAAGVGNPVVYVGAKTGRDGIHGATMASAEFSDETEAKRPTVQVGDPFTEKLLLEACLELMQTDTIVAIQDMGAAGLTSSSFEMASRGNVGIEMDLDQVPMRETGMTPYEIMLSESQERMLLVLKEGAEDQARAIMAKWDLDYATVGKVTDTGSMVLRWHGDIVADVPIAPVSGASPVYQRPYQAKPSALPIVAESVKPPMSHDQALLQLIGSPDLASKRWIFEQYDHTVMADTVQRPGGDAAVVRIHGTDRALAMTTDCTPRYCHADPVQGGRQAVAEAWRNLTAVGARPLGVTDCLNFGNPENPEIMGQFVGCLEGIGGVGLLDDLHKSVTIAYDRDGLTLVLIGEAHGWLGSSLYLREICGREEGAPPPVELAIERQNGDLVRQLIQKGDVAACHDVADGGMFVALAEMAIASNIGATLDLPDDGRSDAGWLFGEDQGRYLLAIDPASLDSTLLAAREAGVVARAIGGTGGGSLTLQGYDAIGLSDLIEKHESWLPDYMSA